MNAPVKWPTVAEIYAEADERCGDFGAVVTDVGYGYTRNPDRSVNIIKWNTHICRLWPDRFELYTSSSPKDGEHKWFPRPGGFTFNAVSAPRSVKHGEVAKLELFGKTYVIPRGALVRVDKDRIVEHTPLPIRTIDKKAGMAARTRVREHILAAAASARLAGIVGWRYANDGDIINEAFSDNPNVTKLHEWSEFTEYRDRSRVLKSAAGLKRVADNFINRCKNKIYERAGIIVPL